MKSLHNYIWTALFLMLLMTSLGAKGAGKGYSVVYSYFSPIEITDVIYEDTATVISFVWHTRSNACRLDIPELVYLVDSKTKTYKLKDMNGVNIGKNIREKNQNIKFTMAFEALSEKEVIFDLVSGVTFDRVFCFYGIHKRKKGELAYKSYSPQPANTEKDEDYTEHGNTHLQGILHGYSPSSRKIEARINCISHSDSYDVFKGFISEIDSLGRFELDIPSIGPRWTYLYIDGAEIPVYLIPDDTISCTIKNFRQYNQKCEVASVCGRNVHPRLLRADPNGPFCPQLANRSIRLPLKKTKKQIEQELHKIEDFYRYLSWKYNLTEGEVSLMMLNAAERLEIIWNRAVCTQAGENDYSIPTEIMENEKWETCPEAASLKLTLERWKSGIR